MLLGNGPLSGLSGIVIVGAALYFTGAGGWLMERVEQLPSACNHFARDIGFGSRACSAIPNAVGDVWTAIERNVPGLGGDVPSADDLMRYAQREIQFDGLSQLRAPQLNQYMDMPLLRRWQQQGDIAIQFTPETRLRLALTQGSIGAKVMDTASDPDAALRWLQSSASMDEFGVLSQLQLGNEFLRGDHVGRDLRQSYAYHAKALDSVRRLQQLDTPEANALKGMLPQDPATLERSLEDMLRKMAPAVQ